MYMCFLFHVCFRRWIVADNSIEVIHSLDTSWRRNNYNILVHDKRTIEPRCILIHLQRYFAYFVLLCAQQRNQLQKTTVKVMFNLTKNMFIYIFMITPKWPDTFEIDYRQVSARVISQSCLFCHFHFEFPLIAGIVFKFEL